MLTIILSILGGITILLSVILYLAYKYQSDIIYSANNPHRDLNKNDEGNRNPEERGINFEDLSVKTSDKVRLHGWFLKQSNHSFCPTIIFFHDMGNRLPFISKLFEATKCNIFVFSYRGYGFSEGSPSETGIKNDIIAILDYVFDRKDIPTNKVFIWGTSFGAAATIYAALTNPNAKGIVLENPFRSLDDMIDRKIKLKFIRKLILRNNWRNIDLIGKVKNPIMFLTGLKDPVVPPQDSEDLKCAALNAEIVIKHEFPEGLHRDMWKDYDSQYFEVVNDYFKKCLA